MFCRVVLHVCITGQEDVEDVEDALQAKQVIVVVFDVAQAKGATAGFDVIIEGSSAG